MKKRIFIAIDLSKEIKQNLVEMQNKISFRQGRRGTRWVEPDHMHLTLVFLGDAEEEKISKIEKICYKVAQKIRPFEIAISSLSAFPNLTRAHTLWLGVENSDELNQLQEKLKEGLKEASLRIEERKFTPHLTLARLKKKKNLRSEIENFKQKNFGIMKVNEFNIFESKLSPKGAKHKIINSFRFKNNQ